MESPTLFDTPAASTEGASGRRPAVPRPRRVPRAELPPRHRRVALAVDGDSLVHRAFHATSEGDDPRATVLGLLTAVAEQVAWSALVVGFDGRERTARAERWPAYKAQRPPKPLALQQLLSAMPTLLTDLGIVVVSDPRWEADDVLGSVAAAARSEDWCSVVATSDRDAWQLVRDDCTVLRLRSGMWDTVPMTPREVQRATGVQPAQYVEFAALRGDPSDNLPGVNGIGPRRAKLLLRAFPTVAEAVADPLGCRSVLGPELGQALIDDVTASDSVFLRNVELMTINAGLPVDLHRGAERRPADRVERTARDAGLQPIAARVAATFGIGADGAVPTPLGAR